MPIVTVNLWQSAVDGILKFVDQVGQEAVIENVKNRSPKAGGTGSRRISETFATVPKMAFDTEIGSTTFDGTGTERTFETTAYMEYISGVNSEQLVLFQDKKFEILNVEDIGLIHGVLVLQLALLGDSVNKAAQA